MITAQELLGIKPHKTLTGRVINNDDPLPIPIWDQRRGTGMVAKVAQFVESVEGKFSTFDAVEAVGWHDAGAYLHKLKQQGKVRVIGRVKSPRSKHGLVTMWEKVG